MRKALLVAVFSAIAFHTAAQTTERPRPPGTTPLEVPPPLPPVDYTPPAKAGVKVEPAMEPEVRTRTEGDNTIQEYRVKGKVYMMRVQPKNGPAYILMDQQGDGTFTRHDNPLDTGNRVPQWVLKEF
jgi:uncharacterized protein DUF2782